MSRNLPSPFFPIAPESYDQRYFSEVIRAFAVFIDQQRNPGEGRHTSMVLTDLPSSEFGLAPGSLFHDKGFVKIALSNLALGIGTAATGSVGSVTVSTT